MDDRRPVFMWRDSRVPYLHRRTQFRPFHGFDEFKPFNRSARFQLLERFQEKKFSELEGARSAAYSTGM